MKKHLLLLGFALAVPSALRAQSVIGQVFASDASVHGEVHLLAAGGTQVISGSRIAAGEDTARLDLERGGQLRICPRTNLSVSSDAAGRSLVLGLNTGSMELNYPLRSSTDSLVTPDFRLQLVSPGNFHLAISVGSTGDTCLRSLPGNDAAVFVTEMMSGESFQLSPGKSVQFRGGHLANVSESTSACGCPAPRPQPFPAIVVPPPPVPAASAPVVRPQPSAEPHLEVNSTFVFRGSETVPDYSDMVVRLRLSSDNSQLALALMPKVSPPPAKPETPQEKGGLFHRLSSFFRRLFGG